MQSTSDKEVKKPAIRRRVAEFKSAFGWFIDDLREADLIAEAGMTNVERAPIVTATSPFRSDAFRQPFMPALWIRPPLQRAKRPKTWRFA